MDVLDAGVYVSKWEASVPRHAQMTMWGPLQAKEMGLDGWDVQDGGETGFVLHQNGVHVSMGRSTATLIFVRRLERAFLTVYLGGYPTDAPAGQRKLDMQKAVNACELFLGRLAKQPVRFELKGEMALVDNGSGGNVIDVPAGGKLLGGGRRKEIIDADAEIARKAGYVPATGAKGKVIDGDAKATKVAGKKGDIWEV